MDEPIVWRDGDPESGLMTIEEHSDYMYAYEQAQRKKEIAVLETERAAGNIFNYDETSKLFQAEYSQRGIPRRGRRLMNALVRSCFEYWPKEWQVPEETYVGPWTVSFRLPEALRHGRTRNEVLALLIGYCIRTRNTKAAVRNYLLRPRDFLAREERHLVKARLAK